MVQLKFENVCFFRVKSTQLLCHGSKAKSIAVRSFQTTKIGEKNMFYFLLSSFFFNFFIFAVTAAAATTPDLDEFFDAAVWFLFSLAVCLVVFRKKWNNSSNQRQRQYTAVWEPTKKKTVPQWSFNYVYLFPSTHHIHQ